MRARTLPTILLLCVLARLATDSVAQTTTGAPEGPVTDTMGVPVEGVEVFIENSRLQDARTRCARPRC